MKVLAFILFNLIALNISSQSNLKITQLKKHKFSDGDVTGRLHKFEHVFAQAENDLQNFRKFNRARKTQKILNYSYLGIAALGVSADLISSCNNCTNDFSGALSLGGILAAGTLMIISNAIIVPIKRKRKKKLLRAHWDGDDPYSLIKNKDLPVYLNASVINNGISLALNF